MKYHKGAFLYFLLFLSHCASLYSMHKLCVQDPVVALWHMGVIKVRENYLSRFSCSCGESKDSKREMHVDYDVSHFDDEQNCFYIKRMLCVISGNFLSDFIYWYCLQEGYDIVDASTCSIRESGGDEYELVIESGDGIYQKSDRFVDNCKRKAIQEQLKKRPEFELLLEYANRPMIWSKDHRYLAIIIWGQNREFGVRECDKIIILTPHVHVKFVPRLKDIYFDFR